MAPAADRTASHGFMCQCTRAASQPPGVLIPRTPGPCASSKDRPALSQGCQEVARCLGPGWRPGPAPKAGRERSRKWTTGAGMASSAPRTRASSGRAADDGRTERWEARSRASRAIANRLASEGFVVVAANGSQSLRGGPAEPRGFRLYSRPVSWPGPAEGPTRQRSGRSFGDIDVARGD